MADCAVIGVPDAEYGERLLALVETSQQGALTEAELKDWLRGRLAAYKLPRSFAFQALPRDDNGKIAKRKLRDAHWGASQRKV